ncbi:MAG: PaRep2b protein [Candidatus Omnitrophica bacterium]|nr:PaRep2b protein [Candidatus Omnitrophota bacterium]
MEILNLIKILKSLSITHNIHIAMIIRSSRSNVEIANIIKALKSLGITQGTHIALILQSSRSNVEIASIIKTLNILGITEGYHIALILHSSRSNVEIKSLIKTLKILGITEGYHIAIILHSSRSEAEIERIIKALKSLGITQGTHIALILQSSRSEAEIERIIKALKSLGITEGTHIALILQSSRKKVEIERLIKTLKSIGITESTHIALILRSSSSEVEIKKLIGLKRVIVQEKGDGYSEYFIRDMLITFAFMDDPLPLLREIMNLDFTKIRSEIEQMPINTTRQQFEQKYGNMAVWILKFFGRNFGSLRAIIRGYAKELLLLDIMPDYEQVIASSDSVERSIDAILLKDSLARAIGQLSDAEQKAIQLYLDGYSEKEISHAYPDISLPRVFAKLREIITEDLELLESIEPLYDPTTEIKGALRTFL